MKGISVRKEFDLMTKNVNLLLLTARKLGTCTGIFRQTQYTMRSMRLCRKRLLSMHNFFISI